MGWRTSLVVLCAFPCLLRSELLPIRTYTIADGLASQHVDCIVPDSRGFLWFCTPEGLSRFDGYRFVSYGTHEGLPHQAITALVETPGGEYFVGTARGLARMNPTGQATRFTKHMPDPVNGQNFVSGLRVSPDGRIWCATVDSLYQWSAATGFRRRQLPLPPHVAIASIVEDGDGGLWVGTGGGIYLLEKNGIEQTFTVQEGLPGYWVEMLLMDSKGRLWAAIRGGLAMIARGAGGKWAVEKVYTGKSGLASSDVKALMEASDGTLWVGTAQGISRLKPGSGEPGLLPNLTRAQGLADRQISALAEDQAGNIWAGTESAGVMRIDRLGFATYREADGLTTDRVFSVFEDRSGELLAITAGTADPNDRSVAVFDRVRFRDVTPSPYARRASWGWNQVLLQSSSGEWWVATQDGLCRYPAVKAAELGGRGPRICYQRQDDIFRVFEDSKGGIWASAQSHRGDQLMRWDPRTDTVFQFPAPRIPRGAADDLVSAFAEDRHGNIWMGLYKGGLYRYDGRGFQFIGRDDGIPGGSVLALDAGGDGLWIGSYGGLGHVADTGNAHPKAESYDAARGLASDIVYCIVEDGHGRVYAGTSKGVDRLDPRTGHIRHFSSGLAHGEFTSAVRDRSGSLWFATKQGLARLVPTEDRPPVHPRVFITDLQVGGASYPLSQVGESWLSGLELTPSQNQLQVDFVGLDYEPGDVLRYSYRLEGADLDWSPPRSQLTVNYAALSGGKYRFQVKAVTSEGVESSSPAGIDFTVLPPLWRRWWFESLAVALAAGLVLAAHRYRVTQMVNLERMRTAIATDLHDDIGASLSHIAVLSEVARAGVGGENRRTQESLERVAVLARELVDSLSDIVWSIRAVPDGLDSLASRMREFALDLLADQRIDFELRAPPAGQSGQQLSLQARRHLFLMFKECIHNASRHSACTAVKAELKVVEREILLTVADNGRGVQLAETSPGSSGGNGIPGMRRRAETLGGSIRIVSEPGKGCTVSMRLPLRRSLFAAYRA